MMVMGGKCGGGRSGGRGVMRLLRNDALVLVKLQLLQIILLLISDLTNLFMCTVVVIH